MRQDDSEAEVEAPVDPELAAALESYKKSDVPGQAPSEPTPPEPSIPRTTEQPGQMVETTARAEDVPSGFIIKEGNGVVSPDTDKVAVTEQSQGVVIEHNSIDNDEPGGEPKSPMKPTELAEELDEVVARFEKEMNRADKD